MGANILLITAVILLGSIVIILIGRMTAIKREMRSMIRQLEETGAVSDENHSDYIRMNHVDHDLEKLAEIWNQKMKSEGKLKVEIDRQYEQMLQMVSGLAHDFRTPITVILGYLELMERDDIREKNTGKDNIQRENIRKDNTEKKNIQRENSEKENSENKNRKRKNIENNNAKVEEYLAAIRNRTLQLNTSVNRLYDYFRMENRKTVQNHPLDLKLFIPKILGDLYQVISGYDVSVNLEIKCTDSTITAEEEMMSRVMENLFINAAKYNTGKTIDVTICSGGSDSVEVSISNDSAPFYDDELERIFDLFYRKDCSRHDGSSGIGLSIVRAFVEKMNGKVVAEYVGQRFRITVSLPK